MKVSVLVSCFNYAEFVGQALDSALGQDYAGPVEVVAVNDGSTDGSGEVLESYGGRICHLCQENRGQAAAFNVAYAHSSGDVICLLDADDVWRPNKVRRVVDQFFAGPQLGLVHHDLAPVDREGRMLAATDLFAWTPADGDLRRLMRKTVLEWCFVPTSGISLSREVCERVFPLRESLKSSADELIAPVAALLSPVKYLREALGFYRIHGSNIWATEALGKAGGYTDKVRAARRAVQLLEEKVAQANRVLRDCGSTERLSPWVSWKYVRVRALVERRRPIFYLPRAARAVAVCPHLSPFEKLGRLAFFLRKAGKYLGRARL